MSYARFIESDVYMFSTFTGIVCCACFLVEIRWVEDESAFFKGYIEPVNPEETTSPEFKNNHEAIEHLEKHIKAGHAVPQRALDRLRDPEDAKDNEEFWARYKKDKIK